MNHDIRVYVIMCGISVHAVVEAKRPASVFKQLILVFVTYNLKCEWVIFSYVWKKNKNFGSETCVF